jgi:hypothetical protein
MKMSKKAHRTDLREKINTSKTFNESLEKILKVK